MAIPLEYCLVFGALISPTDPIATLGILKTVSAPKSLEMKITGEALFNDGMGIILVMVLVEWVDGRAALWTIQKVVWFFTQYALGGLLLGVLLGICARAILRTINDAGVAIILTLALVMGGYTFSEIVVEVSGAICMTVTGLIVGSSLHEGHMTQETRHRLNAFWELIDEILNAILFVWIGLEILHMSFSMDTLLAALAAIVIVISARWVSVMVPVASTNLFRNFNSNIIWLMTWGGLRGGISIALALSIPYGHNRDFIIAITYCVVLFSLGIQGLTLPMLLRRTVLKAEMAL
jgi:CPA1 family monovalent cation:H+ antiporter